MVAQEPSKQKVQTKEGRRQLQFRNVPAPHLEDCANNKPCDIVAVEKRRDGGTRYWCLAHRADATAKYGKAAQQCRAAHTLPIRADEILTLDLDKYRGGVALWGAVPAVYDTTRLPMDRGIHVHARVTPDSQKEMDWTYRSVRLVGKDLPSLGIEIDEIDAIYYMVSSVFGYEMIHVTCTHCGWSHLDKDWFSVHPHRRHLCAGCGRHFYDRATGIGNPIVGIRQACGLMGHKIESAAKNLDIQQAEYPGGLQIWGSNPAFLWTSAKHEEEGIHVHAFLGDNPEPDLDDTFHEVTIDGVKLDAEMVRVLMAQSVMPSLKGRVHSMTCKNCGYCQFDVGETSYVPSARHICSKCGSQIAARGKIRKVVANPLVAVLGDIAKLSPRAPQQHSLDLLTETL